MNFNDTQKEKVLKLSKELSSEFNEEEAEEFANKHTEETWYTNFKLLFDMIRDKEYVVDKKTYLMIAGALAYVVFPLDVIPDFIPGVGFLDDAFVLGFVIKQLQEEIYNYKRFKSL
jgi:uncharacterized membrane protein YkvA (DUF1232 family)